VGSLRYQRCSHLNHWFKGESSRRRLRGMPSSSLTEMPKRDEIRQRIRARRERLDPQFRQDAAFLACTLCARSNTFLNSKRIAVYFPYNGELDILPLMEQAWSMGKTCYLPVLDTLKRNHLLFAPFRKQDRLSQNRFGIPEPTISRRHWLPAGHLDLLLTPLVAFDTAGNRLGMGGGFYDRTLYFLKYRRYWRKPHVYGFAYEFQKLDHLPQEPWDVPLHGIVTESNIYRISP